MSRLREREEQLAAIDLMLEKAAAGSGSCVVVEGARGTGLSALLEAASARGRRRGMAVLSGRGAERERSFDLGLVLQLLEGWLAGAGEERLADLGNGPGRGTLGRLEAGELTVPAGRQKGTTTDVVELTAAIAATEPLLIVVDDLQWADPGSLDYLRELASRVEDEPVALLVAAHLSAFDGDRDLGAWIASTATTRVETNPLSFAACQELVGELMPEGPDALSADCFRFTSGNPLLIRELLGVVGGRAVAAGSMVIAPEALEQAIGARIARLSSDALTMARALAVIGPEPRPGVIRALTEMPEKRFDLAIAELRDEAIMPLSTAIEIADPEIAHAITAAMPRSTRSELHRRAANVLADAGACPQQVASQLLRTLPAGDPAMAKTLRKAAHHALASGDAETAARQLQRALDEPPDVAERPHIMRELAESEALVGLPGAAERLAEAIAALDASDERIEATISLARLHRHAGRVDAATAALEAVTAETDERAPLRLEIDAERLLVALASVDPEGSERIAGALLARVRSGQTLPPLTSAAVAKSLAYAGERREQAIELASVAEAGDQGADAETEILVAEVMLLGDEPERSLQAADRAIGIARGRGSRAGEAHALGARARALLRLGRVREGILAAESARNAEAGVTLLEALTAAAPLEVVSQHLEENGTRPSDAVADARLMRVHGVVAGLYGRSEESRAAFLAAGRSSPWANPAVVGGWRAGVAVMSARLGRADEATAFAEEELLSARKWGSKPQICMALRARGAVADGLEAISYFKEAIETVSSSSAPLERCGAEISLGAALRRSGQRVEARAPLEAAVERAAAVDALGLLARARDELALCGAEGRDSSAAGVDSLTPGELRVARMAAGGMTNREIAASLQVSLKAVQWHLRNTYRKLDIEDRKQLAAKIAG